MALRDDWMKRMLSQLASTLARAMGLRAQGQFEQALDETRDKTPELVGIPRQVLDMVDPAGAAMMIREPKKADAYAQLLEADADTYDAMGRPQAAAEARARASAVRAALPRP